MENGDKIKFTEEIAILKTEVYYIKKQVSNHIPSALEDLNKQINRKHELIDQRLNSIEKKLAVWGGIIAVAFLIIEIASKFII